MVAAAVCVMCITMMSRRRCRDRRVMMSLLLLLLPLRHRLHRGPPWHRSASDSLAASSVFPATHRRSGTAPPVLVLPEESTGCCWHPRFCSHH